MDLRKRKKDIRREDVSYNYSNLSDVIKIQWGQRSRLKNEREKKEENTVFLHYPDKSMIFIDCFY